MAEIADTSSKYPISNGYEDCPHCQGTGKRKHECNLWQMTILKTKYANNYPSGNESLIIRRCRLCGKLWKIRQQWDAGTGSDDIWLEVGQSERGYTFTGEEAREVDATWLK